MNGARVALAVLLLGAAAACGSRDGASLPSYTKVDDMEGGSGLSWWSATDCTEADRILPVPYIVDLGGWTFEALPAPHETLPGTLSAHAARLRTTSPLTGVWGANMGFNFAASAPAALGPAAAGAPCRQTTSLDFPGTPADLGAYDGITFWGMAASPGTSIIRVQLNDRNTDPRAGVCNAAAPASESDCYNAFGTELTLTDTFTQYTIHFADLQQKPGWGYHPDPDALDLQHVYDVNFEIDLPACTSSSSTMCAGGPPSVSFDFWIDDVYLVDR
jgi:hypothetical protein